MSLLVLVEHQNQVMHPATANTLSAALTLDNDISCLVIGSECRKVAEQAARLQGVSRVWLLDNPEFQHPSAEQIRNIVMTIAGDFDAILTASSTFGKNILPGIAAKLDVTQVSDVTKIIDKSTFEHPIYAGNAIETVRVLDKIKVLSIRSTAFEAVTASQPAAAIEDLTAPAMTVKSTFVRHNLSQSERPDLGSAKIVVSGGRGLQNAEKFKMIEDLADALGAAVGASRAAVDAGFVPNDYQVGQTGRVVAPTLYIAIGISGAIQHMAGMKDSKVIVAINKDEDAPIFQIANYGLVGDLFELVPELIKKITE